MPAVFQYAISSHTRVPILIIFRNTIRIISTEIEYSKTENTELLERICNVFEIGWWAMLLSHVDTKLRNPSPKARIVGR